MSYAWSTLAKPWRAKLEIAAGELSSKIAEMEVPTEDPEKSKVLALKAFARDYAQRISDSLAVNAPRILGFTVGGERQLDVVDGEIQYTGSDTPRTATHEDLFEVLEAFIAREAAGRT